MLKITSTLGKASILPNQHIRTPFQQNIHMSRSEWKLESRLAQTRRWVHFLTYLENQLACFPGFRVLNKIRWKSVHKFEFGGIEAFPKVLVIFNIFNVF